MAAGSGELAAKTLSLKVDQCRTMVGSRREGWLFAVGFAAYGMFQIFVEMFADLVKRLTIFLQTADEESAFESGDDESGDFLRTNTAIDLTMRDAFADDFG